MSFAFNKKRDPCGSLRLHPLHDACALFDQAQHCLDKHFLLDMEEVLSSMSVYVSDFYHHVFVLMY
jgi:hypothetical protein